MIHKFKLGGFYIVLDVNSGGVHSVDELTYDLLDYAQPPFDVKNLDAALSALSDKYSTEDIKEAFEEVKELYNDKILFSDDDYEKFAKYSVVSPIKAMCLLISQDCNLRCKYCFASTGDYGEGRKLMTFETGKKAIDFLINNSGDRVNLELDFFGGEPLMNFDVVTTNGMLLTDDKIDFINEEMSNVVLSIDGRKEVNDRLRVRVDGTGSYDKILEGYKKLVSKRGDKDYYVRGTYTKYNLDFSNDVMHLYDLGFDQVSVEPVMADKEMPYAIVENDLEAIYKEYEVLADKLEKIRENGGFCNFFHFMLDLDQGPCAIKRLRGCGSGNEYVAITPDGDIYPCHQFVGIPEFIMGNLEDGTFDNSIKEKFANTHVYAKDDCKKCWAKFYCSGGCNANNFLYEGDILKAHKLSCKLMQKRLECAIMLQIKRHLEA